MTLNSEKKKMAAIIGILKSIYPKPRIQLNYSNNFELLVATILSAQCTGARVNIVTQSLFKKYSKLEDYALANPEELEQDIFSTGYYKAKAKHIIGAARMIIDEFGGEVPSTIEELTRLPGVGRKSANVLLGHCFDTPAIVVDTHVIRICNRLGFVETKNAVKIEKKLMEIVPKADWVDFTHYLILHGRKTCKAPKPFCLNCEISAYCDNYHIIKGK